MNLRRLSAMARKETLHVVRDPFSLGMALGIPLFLLLLFGYALTLDVDDVPIVILDRSGTAASRDFASRFTGSGWFSAGPPAASIKEVRAALDEGRVVAGLTIPREFADDLAAGRTATVQLLVDGSDSNTATIALGYAEGVVRGFSESVRLARVARIGGETVGPPLEVRARVWYDPELRSRNAIVPGLIAVIMMVIAALLTSLSVAREWERGTLAQLVATPVTPGEVVLGKLAPYFLVGMLDVTLAVIAGEVLFDVPFRGSRLLLFATAAVFLVGALSLGLAISILAKSQLVASQLAMVTTFLPAFLLSGFLFRVENMPAAMRAISRIVPATYFVTLLEGIYLKGTGLGELWRPFLLLAAFAAAMLFVARASFRKRLG